MQVCRDLLQKGARELYEGYKAYALNTPLPWMQAIDAAAVRQVGSRFLWESGSCRAHAQASAAQP